MNENSLPFQPRVAQLARRTDVVHGDRHHVAYDYTDEIVVAINAALATRRPLLLRGTPGCGKSTLGRDVALALDRDFAERVITSRTTARDLLWTFDAVRRLSDAAPDPARARNPENYVKRGVLWHAFAPEIPSPRGIVVLLDEIDKADPDVPNDLLGPLGEDRFEVTDVDPPRAVKRQRDVLILITTNGERELPPAFLRRCVSLTLEDPSTDPTRLKTIAERHLIAAARDKGVTPPKLDATLLGKLVARVGELTAALASTSRRPGTAEILDALKACVELGVTPGSDDWTTLTRVLLHKESGNPDKAEKQGTP